MAAYLVVGRPCARIPGLLLLRDATTAGQLPTINLQYCTTWVMLPLLDTSTTESIAALARKGALEALVRSDTGGTLLKWCVSESTTACLEPIGGLSSWLMGPVESASPEPKSRLASPLPALQVGLRCTSLQRGWRARQTLWNGLRGLGDGPPAIGALRLREAISDTEMLICYRDYTRIRPLHSLPR